MGQPFVGEIRMTGFNFAPQGWAFCDGSTLSIAQSDVLFNLIGTTYGGDGVSTFALPNLLGRTPVHQGTNPINGTTYVIGQLSGTENVTLTVNQIPVHSHVPQAATGASGNPDNSPENNVWSGWAGAQFTAQAPAVNLNAAVIGPDGGSQPHDNMGPFQVINFVISLFGVFPSQG
jgi:microcystin-dependent protein